MNVSPLKVFAAVSVSAPEPVLVSAPRPEITPLRVEFVPGSPWKTAPARPTITGLSSVAFIAASSVPPVKCSASPGANWPGPVSRVFVPGCTRNVGWETALLCEVRPSALPVGSSENCQPGARPVTSTPLNCPASVANVSRLNIAPACGAKPLMKFSSRIPPSVSRPVTMR